MKLIRLAIGHPGIRTLLLFAVVFGAYHAVLRLNNIVRFERLRALGYEAPASVLPADEPSRRRTSARRAPEISGLGGLHELMGEDSFQFVLGDGHVGPDRVNALAGVIGRHAEFLADLRADPRRLVSMRQVSAVPLPTAVVQAIESDVLNASQLLQYDVIVAIDAGDWERVVVNICTLYGLARSLSETAHGALANGRLQVVQRANGSLERLLASDFDGALAPVHHALQALATDDFMRKSLAMQIAEALSLFRLPHAEQSRMVAGDFGEFSDFAWFILAGYKLAGFGALDEYYVLEYYRELLTIAGLPHAQWSRAAQQRSLATGSGSDILFRYGRYITSSSDVGLFTEARTLAALKAAELALGVTEHERERGGISQDGVEFLTTAPDAEDDFAVRIAEETTGRYIRVFDAGGSMGAIGKPLAEFKLHRIRPE